jgi:hypothetical protein
MATRTLSLRIPRGLWNDLEETIIHQDRQFLTEVARSLGLPVPEVLRRCLGTGAPQIVPLLWSDPKTDEPDQCPWWECHGDGLWRRCPRLRLSATLPCQIHERCTPCPLARLHSDPVIQDLPFFLPVRMGDRLYWVDPTGVGSPYREDGTVETEFTFRRITHKGRRIWVRVKCGLIDES